MPAIFDKTGAGSAVLNSASRSARRFLQNILVSVCFAPSPHAKILAPQRGRRASQSGPLPQEA